MNYMLRVVLCCLMVQGSSIMAMEPESPALPIATASAREMCAICQEEESDATKLIVLDCGHPFHHDCLWAQYARGDKHSSKCCLCRADISADVIGRIPSISRTAVEEALQAMRVNNQELQSDLMQLRDFSMALRAQLEQQGQLLVQQELHHSHMIQQRVQQVQAQQEAIRVRLQQEHARIIEQRELQHTREKNALKEQYKCEVRVIKADMNDLIVRELDEKHQQEKKVLQDKYMRQLAILEGSYQGKYERCRAVDQQLYQQRLTSYESESEAMKRKYQNELCLIKEKHKSENVLPHRLARIAGVTLGATAIGVGAYYLRNNAISSLAEQAGRASLLGLAIASAAELGSSVLGWFGYKADKQVCAAGALVAAVASVKLTKK